MFREPKARVSPTFDVPRQIHGSGNGTARKLTRLHSYQVEHGNS